MSFPVNPAGSAGSQPKVVSLPQTQRIVQDIVDCIQQLKEEFSANKAPISDDNQVLQRMCAKIEHLLQYEMKERYSMLGKRKDYWDYFCDCLASNKGANDGIKYVKTLGEHKSSLGKGRAFIRFALVHQRLADSLQQCIIHPKTGDWYNTASVWIQSKVSSAIIGQLYDLNDIHFDLSPRGYDLDNAWPSFARNNPGGGNWNVPLSRRSSITSMDTLSIVSTDPSEINRLQQELASAETARSALAESVTSLEQDRQRAEKSVWMTQGELSALQEQLRSSASKFEDLRKQHSALEKSHTQLQADKTEKEEEIVRRTAQLDDQQQRLSMEKERLAQQEADLAHQLTEERSRSSSDTEAMQQKLNEVTETRDKLSAKVASLEENIQQMRVWDEKKDQQILRLEQQLENFEQRNKELTEELSKNLSSREHDASSQLQSAQKLQDLLSKLKDVEADNVKLQGSIVDLKHKCEVLEKTVQEEKTKGEDLQTKLSSQTQTAETLSADLKNRTAELEKERASSKELVEKLQSDLKRSLEESERTKTELKTRVRTLSETENQTANLTKFVSQLMQVVSESAGDTGVTPPEVSSCSESEMTTFVETCRKWSCERFSTLQARLEEAEKQGASLTSDKTVLLQAVDSVLETLPDKPDCKSMDLPQKAREVETRVQSLCTQLSDVTTNNSFVKEQLQLAQGEHSDKGKQLSHLEGRLSELEKMLKESRSSESALQGQVASMEVTVKNLQSQREDLQAQLHTSEDDASSKAKTVEETQAKAAELEKQKKCAEKQVHELNVWVEKLEKEAEIRKEREETLKGRVQELEKSLEVSQLQIEEKASQLSGFQQKLKEGEETVENFLSAMASLESDKATVVTEQDTLKQQLTDATTQLETTAREKQEKQNAMDEAQREIAELSKNVARLADSLESKESELKSLQASFEQQKQGFEEERSQLSKTLEDVQSDVSQKQEELNQANARLSEVTSLKESSEAEKIAIIEKLEAVSATLKEKEVSSSEEIHTLRTQLDSYKTEKEELRQSASSSQEESTQLLTDKQHQIATLQQEKADLEKQVKNLSRKSETLEADVRKVQAEMDELKQKHATDTEKSAQEFQQTQSQLQSALDKLNHENADLTSQLKKVQSDLTTKTEEMEALQDEIEKKKTETERLRSDSETEKSELEASLEKLQSRFTELQTALDAVIKEKEDLTTLQETLQEEITELKADLASSSDGYNFLLQSSQKVYEEKDVEIETLKSQLAELEQAKSDLSSKLDSSSSQNSTADERLKAFESQEQTWKEKETELEKQLADKQQEVEDLKEKVRELTESLSLLEAEEKAKGDKLEELETTLQEKENSYSSQVESLQQELSALQFQLSAEQLQHEESLKTMGDSRSSAAEMSSQLAQQEGLVSELEKELSSLQMEFETERTNQNQQLDELKTVLKAKEKECRQLAEKLQQTSDKLDESLASTELYQKENGALRRSLDRDIEEREEEIRTLRSDNEELKKQLVKVVRDKAALWQQTDALAYEHKRKSEGKWMDNSAVTKCVGCRSDFSLFLRKHHCRMCGRIFCFNCSDNWVDSASSSRKARACAQCYEDLQNLDASIVKASLLPNVSDDEDSTAGSDVMSQQGSQADSRSQTSLLQATSPDTSVNAGGEHSNVSPASSTDNIYSRRDSPSPDLPDLTSTPSASAAAAAASDASASESESQSSNFQVITQEEVTKSIAAYDDLSANPTSLIDVPNMSSSMLLSAEDLAKGEINTQNEVWVKPGHSFAVPIVIEVPSTVVTWEFTVHPKDIQFSIKYNRDKQEAVSEGEVVVAPTRCNSLKEPVTGELTAKAAGVYTLVFDNSYSRMTSKKVHYSLKYDS